jgi:hypothetical protein
MDFKAISAFGNVMTKGIAEELTRIEIWPVGGG